MDKPEPKRTKLRSDNDDAICTNSSIDTEDPKVVIPYIDICVPRRTKTLNDREDPRLI